MRYSLHKPFLPAGIGLLVVACFLGSQAIAASSAEERGKEADFCSPGSKPLNLDTEFAIPLLPPPGTKVDEVAGIVEQIKSDIEILKHSWVAAALIPASYTDQMGANRAKDIDHLTARYYSDPNCSGALCKMNPFVQIGDVKHDPHSGVGDFGNDSFFSIAADKPPYKVVLCPYKETCSGKEEPLTKSKLREKDLELARVEMNHAGYGTENFNFQIMGIAMELAAQASIKPGDYMQTIYFSATIPDFTKMEISPSALDSDLDFPEWKSSVIKNWGTPQGTTQASQMILSWAIQQGTKISERTEGDWRIVSIKFDPATLCKHARPNSELYTK